MKKIIGLVIFFSLLIGTNGYSQQNGYTSVQYGVSFATGDMGEYISAVSWRGFLVEYKKPVNDNLLAGIDVGWNVFYERKPDDTYTRGTESLSGVQYRYQNEVPILATLDYLIESGSALKPYVGIGIGTMYSERSTDMNLYRWEQSTWHFTLKAELGMLYEINYGTSVKFSAKYYNGFKTKTLDNQGYVSINLGMTFNL